MSLSGKVVIVTGAGSGIGRATAKLLSSAGGQVVIADINETGGRATLQEIEAAGGQARFVQTDVANEQSVNAMVDETVSSLGSIYGRRRLDGHEFTRANAAEATLDTFDQLAHGKRAKALTSAGSGR